MDMSTLQRLNLQANELDEVTVLEIAAQYRQLAARRVLSDNEAEQLAIILDLAISNDLLDKTINEIDIALFDNAELKSTISSQHIENQKAKLREYLPVYENSHS